MKLPDGHQNSKFLVPPPPNNFFASNKTIISSVVVCGFLNCTQYTFSMYKCLIRPQENLDKNVWKTENNSIKFYGSWLNIKLITMLWMQNCGKKNSRKGRSVPTQDTVGGKREGWRQGLGRTFRGVRGHVSPWNVLVFVTSELVGNAFKTATYYEIY